MSLILTNNAKSNIPLALSATALTLTVTTGQGSVFPVLGTGDWHPATIIGSNGTYEIVRVTARASDVLTIERAQEDTSAVAFDAGSAIEIRLTAAAIAQFALSGQQDFTVLRGLNYAISTGTIGGNLYSASISDIASYTNNLRLSILAHSDNVASTSLVQLNTLASIEIQMPNGDVPHAGAIKQNRIMEVHYRSATGKFVLDNAIPASSSVATDVTAGLALRGTDEDYDEAGDDEAFVTQVNASKIAKNYYDTLPDTSNFAANWTYKGDETTGGALIVTSASSNSVICGRVWEYASIDVQALAELGIGSEGVVIVRCTGTINIDGTINVPRARYGSRELHVGPSGSPEASGTNTVSVSRLPSGASGNAAVIDNFQFEHFLNNGTPMDMFHGGHGGSANSARTKAVGGGGMILIADEIVFGATAIVMGMHSAPADTGLFQGASAGGMLICVAPTVTVDPGARFQAGDPGTTGATGAEVRTFWTDATNSQQITGAGNGEMFTFNPNNGAVGRQF